MKNIKMIKEKLNQILILIDSGVTNPRLKPDDLTYAKIKSNQYLRELELIEAGLSMTEGKLTENEFKDILTHMNKFAKEMYQLIRV